MLLVVQTVFVAPVAMALAPQLTATAAADCDMGAGGAHEDCPCCPPDGSMQGNCAAVCIGVTGPAPAIALQLSAPIDRSYSDSAAPLLPSRAYSPVNPPPIG
jgi:hypothetical protein